MDFIMDWQLIDCPRNSLPVEMGVYGAALDVAGIQNIADLKLDGISLIPHLNGGKMVVPTMN